MIKSDVSGNLSLRCVEHGRPAPCPDCGHLSVWETTYANQAQQVGQCVIHDHPAPCPDCRHLAEEAAYKVQQAVRAPSGDGCYQCDYGREECRCIEGKVFAPAMERQAKHQAAVVGLTIDGKPATEGELAAAVEQARKSDAEKHAAWREASRQEQLERGREALDRALAAQQAPDTGRAGVKADIGKVDLTYFFEQCPLAMETIARVFEFGAEKYTRGGWQTVPDGIARYTKAMLRHYLDEARGIDFDADAADHGFEVRHAAQVAWCALTRLELILRAIA